MSLPEDLTRYRQRNFQVKQPATGVGIDNRKTKPCCKTNVHPVIFDIHPAQMSLSKDLTHYRQLMSN